MWIEKTLRVFCELSIKATFLFPAILAEQFRKYVLLILNNGHEVGCHGLIHGAGEEYNNMPYEKQKAALCESKMRIEDVTQREVATFRAPVFKINGNTIRALEEAGFKADLSVNPQRLGILSSEFANTGWLYAPRKPYHPCFNNPFRRGKSSLWEIPQSAFVLPFMSNAGIALGGNFMKIFFKALYFESTIISNPIVYMVHVEDIYPREIRHRYNFRWRHLLPSNAQGIIFRHSLFHNKSGKTISKQIIGLLEYIKNTNNIQFVTAKEMVALLEKR
jgi:hypothetical protein